MSTAVGEGDDLHSEEGTTIFIRGLDEEAKNVKRFLSDDEEAKGKDSKIGIRGLGEDSKDEESKLGLRELE